MDYIKKTIWGPDPKEQMRKINQLLRKNKRELDRSMNQLQPLKKKTEGLIKKAARANDYKAAKLYAKELININKQYNKLYTSKTKIESINMAVNEQWQMNKLTNSLKASTGVMKDVNTLINLGVVTGTMQELSKELMKAGIINEMVDDMVDLDMDEEEELESQSEVDKIIQKLTEEKFNKINTDIPSTEIENPSIHQEISSPIEQQEQEDDEDEDYEALDEMRERLKALQN